MRLARSIRCSLVLLCAGFPVLVAAQFQEPTRQEIQMTADPRAPGVAAVYLYREDITDQPASTRSFYERIKVLSEKGKEMATVQLPYEPATDKIVEVVGRTIHPDGAVIPLTDKPSELVEVKTKGYQLNSLVFTLPSVEVGSILEYRVKMKYSHGADEPVWTIQQPFFVEKAHYSFKSHGDLANLSVVARIGSDAKVINDRKGTYTLDITDVPALPDEDWMPPLNNFKWRVSFFHSDFHSSAAFWSDAGKNLSAAVREVVNPTSGLKKIVAGIVAPGDADSRKAQKIYAAVMKIENTDFTREKTKAERKKEKIKEIKTVEDVWKQQAGSADDIALLYVALCRSAGLNVDPMKVVDRSRAIFDESFLSSSQFDDYIAVARLQGKDIYLDPGEKMCPFGLLHWTHNFASGLRLGDKVGMIDRTPAANYKNSMVQRIADITVDESGAVTGVIRFVLKGQDALYWRQLSLQNDEGEVKKLFNESMREEIPEGVHAEFDHFQALDDYNSNLMGIVRIRGNLGTATGKRFFLPGLFFQSGLSHPFATEEKRIVPVDVHYPRMNEDDVTYHLPPGYSVESAPHTEDVSWPDHATFNIVSSQSGDTVKVTRTLAYNYTILAPSEYSSLHDFYQKVAAADQQQLVLSRNAPGKGE
jgi:Domain of Unknown Function with PDB structure (DUF3857)/Transglutaminase-like superfamily